MNVHVLALLAGLFAAPAWLAWQGHHLRDRSTRGRGMFWGGVVGHVIAIVVLNIVLFTPALGWVHGDTRHLVVHWSLLLATAAGAAVGGVVARGNAPDPVPDAAPKKERPPR